MDSNFCRQLGFITASLAIQKKNRTLMEQDEGSSDKLEDEEVDGPPAKRLCTRSGRVFLDSDEDAFARSLPSLHLTPGASSQYKDMEMESKDEGAAQNDEVESIQGDADVPNDDDENGEDDQEGVEFLDNGIHLQSLQWSYTYCFYF